MIKEYTFQGIHGVMYTPDMNQKYPCIIFAHGYGGCYKDLEHYGPKLNEANIACFLFDFCGGGLSSTSKGSMWDMSVLTELEDFEIVYENIRSLEYINQIICMGESQGGYVATLFAHYHPEIDGLICWYPAYVIDHDCKERAKIGYKDKNYVWGTPMGRKYIEDALKVNIFSKMDYPKKVLIIHGDQDEIAPIEDSKKAITMFPNAKLYIVKDGRHGFEGNQRWEVIHQCIEYVREL